jgi:hypothetical protein
VYPDFFVIYYFSSFYFLKKIKNLLFEKKNGRPFSFATTQAIIRKRKRKRKDLGGERKKTGLGKKRPSWEASSCATAQARRGKKKTSWGGHPGGKKRKKKEKYLLGRPSSCATARARRGPRTTAWS